MPTTLKVGTPLWREETAFAPSAPGATLTHPVFVGVTIHYTVASDRPLAVTATGDQGVILARVHGPLAVGDAVGYYAGTYLVKDGTPSVGTVLDAVVDVSDAFLARVRVGTGSGGAGRNVRLAQVTDATTVASDYVTAKLANWSGATLTLADTTIQVALPPPLRNATKPADQTIPPGTGETFTWALRPAYASAFIEVAEVPEGTGVTVSGASLTWVDVTPGRGWSTGLPICLGGTTYHVPVLCGTIA